MDFDFEDRSEVCAGCPCAGSPYVPARGKADTRYFCVGSMPGPEESKKGAPFVGPAGSMVKEIMAALALDPVYTNVLKRRPSGKKPTKSECFRCGLHLIEEMKRHEVIVVLTLGQMAFEFINGTGNLTVSNVHGLPMKVNRFGMDLILVSAPDPGYVLRKGGLDSRTGDSWISDLEDYRDMVNRSV